MFVGGRVAVARAEIGQMFQFTPGTSIRLAVGGEGDFSVGQQMALHGSRTGFDMRSEFEGYAELSLDIASSVRLFARGAVAGSWSDLSGETLAEYRLTAGAMFVFDPQVSAQGARR
jgi:hypothetical protein